MTVEAELITRAVREISPNAACFSCLAVRTGLPEADARGAAQAPVIRSELRVLRQVCHWCQRMGDALTCAKGPRLARCQR
jgi:hypothetical protein